MPNHPDNEARTPPESASAGIGHLRWWGVPALLYLALGILLALNKIPWADEAWYGSPAINVLATGSPGTPNFYDIRLPGVIDYTYWEMPGFIVALLGWFSLFGSSVLKARALTLLLGGLTLWNWNIVLRKLEWSRDARVLAIVVVIVNDIFILDATYARSDMMSLACLTGALACYLRLREERWHLAVFSSQGLAVLAGLTHPNAGLLTVLYLLVLGWKDRRRVTWRTLLIAASPYVVGAALWGAYIAMAPGLWLAQLQRNAGGRLGFVGNPVAVIWSELSERYLTAFGLGAHTPGTPSLVVLKAVMLALWIAGVVGCLWKPRLRRDQGVRMMLLLTGAYFLFCLLFEGKRTTYYLIWGIPLYSALAGRWVASAWHDRARTRWFAVPLLAASVLVGIAATVMKARSQWGMRPYYEVVDYVKANAHLGPVVASVEFGFGLGFEKGAMYDDLSLGTWSGVSPALVVVGLRYAEYLPVTLRPTQIPDVTRASAWLRSACRVGFRNKDFQVYTCPPRDLKGTGA